MALTGLQKEKLLKFAGFKYDADFWWTPDNNHLKLGEEPNLDDLNVLYNIIDSKCKIEFKLTMHEFYGKPLYDVWLSDDSTLTSFGYGNGHSLVEAIQNALLKLAEEK